MSRRAAFTGVARDCAAHLPGVLQNLERFAASYRAASFLFVVSDSKDDTRTILKRWLADGRRGRVIDLGALEKRLTKRTERIAFARNTALDEIAGSEDAGHDHLVVADLDDVLARPVDADAFTRAAAWLDADPARAAVMANAVPRYYDVWALRHERWCPASHLSRATGARAAPTSLQAGRIQVALARDHDGAADGRDRAAVVAPDARADMKALIIDPAVHSLGGHHFNAVQRLQDELAGLGVAAPCLGSAFADRRVVEELACTPTFTRSVYGRLYATPGEFADSVEETCRQLAEAMRRSGTPDLIILPCCDQVAAMALARHLRRSWSRKRPRILLWLLYGPHHLKTPDDPAAASLDGEARAAFAELAASAGSVEAYCETPAMADFYRNLVPFEVGVMAGPGLPPRAPPPRAAGGPPGVSFLRLSQP